MEAFMATNLLEWENIIRYKDLLNEQFELKSTEELQSSGWKINLWQKVQLESRYTKDKKKGFQKINS